MKRSLLFTYLTYLIGLAAARPASAETIRSGSIEMESSTYTPAPPSEPFSTGTNILVNPGFESSGLPPWTTDNWVVTNADANSGTYSAEDYGNFYLLQSFTPVNVSAVNSVTMWSKQPEGVAFHAVDFFYGPADFDEFLVAPGVDWTFIDMTAQLRAAGNLEAIRIWGYVGGPPNPDLTRVDDVVIDADVTNATEAGTWGQIKGIYR